VALALVAEALARGGALPWRKNGGKMVEKWQKNGGKMVENGGKMVGKWWKMVENSGKWWKNTKLGCSKMQFLVGYPLVMS